MIWTMFKVNNLWPLIIKFAQSLTQLTSFWKCWHPNQPITVESGLSLIISQIPRYFVYIRDTKCHVSRLVCAVHGLKLMSVAQIVLIGWIVPYRASKKEDIATATWLSRDSPRFYENQCGVQIVSIIQQAESDVKSKPWIQSLNVIKG